MNTENYKIQNIDDYAELLKQVKHRIGLAPKRAIYSANGEMLHMYWDIGKLLQNKIDEANWGDKLLERLSIDLKNEYPTVKGFTTRNCRYMMQFYRGYNQELTFVKLPVSQIEGSNEMVKPTYGSILIQSKISHSTPDVSSQYSYVQFGLQPNVQ